jgi:carbon monoxide dehydrogenase subunit G
VATSLTARLDIPADPAAAYGMLTDPEYVRDVAAATGGTDIEVSATPSDDGGATVVSRRSVPADVPSYARSLVGDSIRVDETRVLGPAADDGSREGTISIDFGGAPASVAGTLRLAASGAGTGLDVELTIKASVPFVGGKIEKLVAEQIHAALDREQTVAATHAP